MTPLTLYNKTEYINISCEFIDHYLCEAPGEFLKIYLYLLRVEADSTYPTISDLADKLDFTEKDVLRALHYWEKQELLSLVYDEDKKLCGIHFQNIAKRENNSAPSRKHSTATPDASLENTLQKAKVPVSKHLNTEDACVVSENTLPKKNYTKTQLAKLAKKPEAQQVIFIAEQYLGTSFNPSELETLLYIYDKLGFSCDLMEYLLGVCVEQHLTALARIEDMAAAWYEKGIKTVSEAKTTTASHRKNCLAVCKALGIDGRTLAESEQAFLLQWMHSYGFSLPFILEACNRTIQATGKPSFPYADSILKNWQRAGVQSMDDIAALDAAHQTAQMQKPVKKSRPGNGKNNNFPQRSYDYPTLEQQLLNVN